LTILIAPDKFKGSLTAKEVCSAVARGLRQLNENIIIDTAPMADGGEGTCDLLTDLARGSYVQKQVHDPLFRPVSARYGLSGNGDTAFIEMAAASGLMLLKDDERNPLLTTTLGTGELISDALFRKVRRVVLGLGGSATVDGGMGMATALGYRFGDADGTELKPAGENLIHIRHIQADQAERLNNIEVIALCDVTNALFGPDGAAFVYGPQKGADASAIALLDAGLRNFNRMVKKYLSASAEFPGAGAAGGLGAGAKVFLRASIEKGIDYIVRTTALEEKIRKADIVITGEGKIDDQTFSGKVVSEVTKLSVRAGKPVVALCGKSDLTEAQVSAQGVSRLITLVDASTSAQSAMKDAEALIVRKIAEQGIGFLRL
jgi:glycerate kinase